MYGERRMGSDSFAPVRVGEELDVRIEAVGEKGDGIARKKGFVLFIPNTKEGDEVRIRVTKVLRKVGFAEVIGEASGPVASEEPKEESRDDVSESSDSAEEEPKEVKKEKPKKEKKSKTKKKE